MMKKAAIHGVFLGLLGLLFLGAGQGAAQDAPMSLPAASTQGAVTVPSPVFNPPPYVPPPTPEAIAALPPDLAAIRRVHQELATSLPLLDDQKFYDAFLDSQDAIAFVRKAWDGLDRLRKAGVLGLLQDDVIGLAPQERARILADYAWWAHVAKQPFWEDDTCVVKETCPLAVMAKAVALDPAMGKAWGQLGNLHRGRLCKTDAMTEKVARTRQALEAFDTFARLGGTVDKNNQEFRAMNLASIQTDDVCAFYLPYLNRGRTGELHAYTFRPSGPIDIAHNGVPEDFDTILDMNTRLYSIKPSNPKTRFFTEGIKITRVNLLEFKGKYYLVYSDEQGLPMIVQANKGKLCSFSRSFAPVLDVNKEPVLCAMLQADKLPPSLAAAKPTPEQAAPLTFPINDHVFSLAPWQAIGAMAVDLDNSGTARPLLQIAYDSKAGRGCTAKWLAFATTAGKLDTDADAMALLRVQEGFEDCRGGSFTPFVHNGVSYIRVDLSPPTGEKTGIRHILKMNRSETGGKAWFETVCTLWTEPSYRLKTQGGT